MNRFPEPVGLKAEITRNLIRSGHRSTTFSIRFDISPLMDDDQRALYFGAEIEEILVEWCRRGVQSALEEGRRRVPNHP